MTATADIFEFTGRCGLERCGGPGHWIEDVTFRLCSNRGFTDFWYEADCAPGQRQPMTRIFGKRGETLRHLKAWKETRAIVDAFAQRHGILPGMVA